MEHSQYGKLRQNPFMLFLKPYPIQLLVVFNVFKEENKQTKTKNENKTKQTTNKKKGGFIN